MTSLLFLITALALPGINVVLADDLSLSSIVANPPTVYSLETSNITVTVTGTGGYMLYLKNTSTLYDAIIARITVSTSALIVITLMKNPTIGSLVNEIAKTPVNKNFKSGKVAKVECYGWDEIGDGITGITEGNCAGTYQVNGFERLLFDEAICLGLNDIIAVKAKGAGEIAIVMHGYYDICDDQNMIKVIWSL